MRIRFYFLQLLTFSLLSCLLACGGGGSTSDDEQTNPNFQTEIKSEKIPKGDGAGGTGEDVEAQATEKESPEEENGSPEEENGSPEEGSPSDSSSTSVSNINNPLTDVTFIASDSPLQEALFSTTFKNATPLFHGSAKSENLNIVQCTGASSSIQRLLQSKIPSVTCPEKEGKLQRLSQFFQLLSKDPLKNTSYHLSIANLISEKSNTSKVLEGFHSLFKRELSRMILIDKRVRSEDTQNKTYIVILTRHKEAFSLLEDLEILNEPGSFSFLLSSMEANNYILALASPQSFELQKSKMNGKLLPFIKDAKILRKNSVDQWNVETEDIPFMDATNVLKKGEEIKLAENTSVNPISAYLSIQRLNSQNVFTLNFLNLINDPSVDNKNNTMNILEQDDSHLGIVNEYYTVDWLKMDQYETSKSNFLDDQMSSHLLEYFTRNKKLVTKIKRFEAPWSLNFWEKSKTYTVPFTFTGVSLKKLKELK